MNAVLEAIKQLTDKVDILGTQIQQSSIMLTSIAKAVEFSYSLRSAKYRL